MAARESAAEAKRRADAAFIARLVAEAPLPSPEQTERLAQLLVFDDPNQTAA